MSRRSKRVCRRQKFTLTEDSSDDDVVLEYISQGLKNVGRRKPRVSSTPNKRGRKSKSTAAKQQKQIKSSPIPIDSDVESSNTGIENVFKEKAQQKFDNFFKAKLSDDDDDDDDDDILLPCVRTTIVQAPNLKTAACYVLSDSEDDASVSAAVTKTTESILMEEEPKPCISGTSTGVNTNAGNQDYHTSLVNSELESQSNKENLSIVTLDSTLDDDDVLNGWDKRQQTDDIINSANALLEKYDGKDKNENEKTKEVTPNQALQCPICLDPIGGGKPATTTMCGHMFCKSCIMKVSKTTKKCPTCRKNINPKKLITVYI